MDAACYSKRGDKKLCFTYYFHIIFFIFQYIIIYIYTIIYFLKLFFQYFSKILGPISHNVPAVYDVLPARIRALRSKDQGWQNVPEQRRGNGAQRNDLAVAGAEPPTGGDA
jgi:hypothetical protein